MTMTFVQRIKCGANQNACAAGAKGQLSASNEEAAVFPLVAVPNERKAIEQILDRIMETL